MSSSPILARLERPPTRLVPTMFTFGGMLGVPALCVLLAAGAFAIGVDALGVALVVLSVLAFAGVLVAVWVLIFQARGRLARAEQALYAGDFDTATREALFVLRTVFRADYQTGALFTLALTAERLGAFAQAGTLFTRALDAIPAMAAAGPGRRARALLSAHAATSFAAANDLARAHDMLARCNGWLGAAAQPGVFDALLDDSYMGAMGINAMLVELENRRNPRPLAVLAALLVAYKSGDPRRVLHVFDHDCVSIEQGLAPHERALAERIRGKALELAAGGGPHRVPGAIAPVVAGPATAWADLALPA